MRCVLAMLTGDREEHNLDELEALARTMSYDIVGSIVQRRPPRPKYLMGSGKVGDLKELTEEKNAELVIFENQLTSRQILSLEEFLDVNVIDKFDLILNVFDHHALSREAKLQVELVRLKRNIPFVKTLLGRRVRAEHPGYGSAGEFIVHSTLTNMRRRIARIEHKLATESARKDALRERRRRLGKIVSLAGYTNSGKTTLFNRLTGQNKAVKDEFFTTLRTKTSRRGNVLINDTIGFINDLPPDLISAFRATLADIRESDLILLVNDLSDPTPQIQRKLEACKHTLLEIGAVAPIVYVFNKIDLTDLDDVRDIVREESFLISAKYGAGVKALVDRIENI